MGPNIGGIQSIKNIKFIFDEFKSVMGLSGCKNLENANTKFLIK